MKVRCNCCICGKFVFMGEQAITKHGHTEYWVCPACNAEVCEDQYDAETGEKIEAEE